MHDRIKIEAKPEVIGITETWLKPYIEDTSFRYNFHLFDRTEKSGKTSGGGLIFYYKDTLDCQPIPELSFCDRNIEIIFLKLNLVRTRLMI